MLEHRPWLKWVAFIFVGTYIEHKALRLKCNDSTLSHFIRLVFKTETSRTGRWAFVGGWAMLSGWFVPHILKLNRDERVGQNMP